MIKRVAADNQRIHSTDGRVRAHGPTTDGKQITGPDLQAASVPLAEIKSELDRRTIAGMFSGFTKYQTLAMLLEPRGKWFKAYPAQMEELVRAATETDVQADASTRIG